MYLQYYLPETTIFLLGDGSDKNKILQRISSELSVYKITSLGWCTLNFFRLLNCGKPGLELRSCGVLSHYLPYCPETTNVLCKEGMVPQLIELLKVNNSWYY